MGPGEGKGQMIDRSASSHVRRLAAAAACIAALGLSACGGGSDSSSSSTSSTSSSGSIDSTDTAALREQFTAGILNAAAKDSTLTQEQSDCLKDKLLNGITDEMLQSSASAGKMTPEMQDVAVQAGIACVQ
jgi:hypothetical protein